MTSAAPTIEIDESTKRGHENFKKMTTFTVSVGGEKKVLRWDEWMKWQATRDPLNDDPKAVRLFRSRAEKEMEAEREAARGPGISRRPKPMKPEPK